MGVDALIFVRSSGTVPAHPDIAEIVLHPVSRSCPPGATHDVPTGYRWFSGRGGALDRYDWWPTIRRLLVHLGQHCERVWYDGDALYEYEDCDEMTAGRMSAMDEAYRNHTGRDPA